MPILVAVIVLLTVGCILARPFNLAEAVWAFLGAACLIVLGAVSPQAALGAVTKGEDVYWFLLGMMALSEVARSEGLFDWLAARVIALAAGSPARLFLLVYLLGVVVTVFLSNDATAVVLTPAVATACARARVENARPYLFACAFVANAASFVLPISNPANLVLYGDAMPDLQTWFMRFALPSLGAIVATYLVLRFTQRNALRGGVSQEIAAVSLGASGHIAAWGLFATAILLGAVSERGGALGRWTLGAALVVTLLVCATRRRSPLPLMKTISWSVIPLVAGLFVIVQALNGIGVVDMIAGGLRAATTYQSQVIGTTIIASATNVFNNLPVGVLAAQGLAAAAASPQLHAMTVVAVDLGPNLSVTGSLATLLWLVVLRREGIRVSASEFFFIGCVVMPASLFCALALIAMPAIGAAP